MADARLVTRLADFDHRLLSNIAEMPIPAARRPRKVPGSFRTGDPPDARRKTADAWSDAPAANFAEAVLADAPQTVVIYDMQSPEASGASSLQA